MADPSQIAGIEDRFSEGEAATTVRSAPSDMEAGVAAIRSTLQTLGTGPGVYRMQDGAENTLYVGKARALKNRVVAYTQVQRLPRRLQRMVSQTRGMTVVTTRSEAEALLLEAQLIKRFRPPYNVLLRDDKSFPFIALDEAHGFARLYKHRGARQPGARYYGPFASAGAVTTTLNALQKMFLLRSCTDSFFANRTRPCLLHQIRRCSAPCVGRITPADYAELVADARAFLSGHSQEVQRKLATRMTAAADGRDYELAAVLRDRLRALTAIQGTQAIHAGGDDAVDADVIALATRDGCVCVQIFFLRGGQNWGHRAVFPAHAAGVSEEEVLMAFLGQFYSELPPAPLLLIDRTLADADVVAQALSARAGFKVEIRTPQRGHRRRLVEQAIRNAFEAAERRLAESTTQLRNLEALAALFEIDRMPERIEIYDNSHVQGSNALGAMVVSGPQGFQPSAYRKFNMNAEGAAAVTPGDDFAMMRAMLGRRFARLEREDPDRSSGQWPDLILIDGGRGQVAAALSVLVEQGISDVAVAGVAKGPDRNAGREIFHLADGRELSLPPGDPLLFFVQRLRDEAHRFAIGAHRRKRAKAMTTSALDDVPGVGPARKKALLMHFGSVRAVRGAAVDDLMKAPGINRATAEAIHGHFHGAA
jgi:excinuclease ABC subunit C